MPRVTGREVGAGGVAVPGALLVLVEGEPSGLSPAACPSYRAVCDAAHVTGGACSGAPRCGRRPCRSPTLVRVPKGQVVVQIGSYGASFWTTHRSERRSRGSTADRSSAARPEPCVDEL